MIKLKRRRKIRRARLKMKNKVIKLGQHWIAKKELFPNVFKMTLTVERNTKFTDFEYQDLSKKFVLPEKKLK